jgi:hypothetical protein
MRAAQVNSVIAAGLLTVLGSYDSANAQQMKCETGPLQRTYGSTPWLVYSCNDGRSIAIVSVPGSPASPFYFFLHPSNGGYRVEGEGTGDKSITDHALAELQQLSEAKIATLIDETRKVQNSTRPN